MNNRFKKTALAVASGLGLMALVPSAFCDREVKLDPFHMQIVGKYFGSSEDIVNLEMVNSKFKDMGKIYRFNPTFYDKVVFTDIETCVVYPQEVRRTVKFENRIKHIVYLEGSFDDELIDNVLKENGALKWKKEITPNDPENVIYGFNLHFYNQEGNVITFCFNPFKLSDQLTGRDDRIYFDRLFLDYNNFLSLCGVNKSIDTDKVKKELKTITLPSSLTVLDMASFLDFKGLEKVYVSDFVNEVSSHAFIGCDNLKEIHYKGKVYKTPEEFREAFKIGPYAGYDNISDIKVLDSIKQIGAYAFEDCKSLKSVVLPSSVEKICNSAFWFCKNLAKVEIPDSVKEIENRAFEECVALTEVKLPYGIKKIADGTFLCCSSLKGISIPDSVKEIGQEAFKHCVNLKNVKISNSTQIIDCCAFENCKLLTEINIPNSVREIRYGAFSECSNLKKINIPDSVLRVDRNVFDGCYSLTHIEYRKKVYKSAEDFITAFCIGPYAGYTDFKDVKISNLINKIDKFAFYNCTSLESVKIPSSVVDIDNSAFFNCLSLSSVKISDSVKKIGDMAFGKCESLTEIEIPDSVDNIGASAFIECENLSSVRLPSLLSEIRKSMFMNCKKLKNIDIPNSTAKIDDYVFYKCDSLKEFLIPESVKEIGKKAFAYCKLLENIQILGDIEEISEGMFYACQSLKRIEIPGTVKKIGANSFNKCISLEEIKIPNGVETIGDCAFNDCVSLSKIVIPDSVVAIGYRTFDGCMNLKSISYKGKDYKSIDEFVRGFIIENQRNNNV